MNSSAINTEDIQYDDDDVCRERFGFSGEVVELAIFNIEYRLRPLLR